MKKKLMMVAVLLGALSLGACVDDNESASVTDIRGAKAEQLRAMAALYQAQADAEAAVAQAEAELRAAEAAYQQALANAKQEEIRQAQAEFEYQIAAIQAKWEAKVAYWNSKKAEYENSLWFNESVVIQGVYDRYVGATDAVNALTRAKMAAQINRSKLEAQMVSADVVVENQIAAWNKELAEEKAKLEKYNAMKEVQPSKEEYQAMLDELEVQAYNIINNDAREALAKEQTTKRAYEDAKEAVEEGDTYAVVTALETLEDLIDVYGNGSVRAFASKTPVTEVAEDAREAFGDKWPDAALDGSFSIQAYNLVATTIEAATLEMNRAFAAELESVNTDIEKAIGKAWEKDDDGNILKGTEQTSVNGAQSAIDYYKQEIASANKEISDLQKLIEAENVKDDKDENAIGEWERQQEEWTAKIKGGTYEKADGSEATIAVTDSYNGLLAQAEIDLQVAKGTLNEKNEEKTEIEADQKVYTDALTVLKNADNQKAYQDAVAALEAPAVAYVEAQSAAEEFTQQLADLGFLDELGSNGEPQPDPNGNGTYQDINKLLTGIGDVQDLIDGCEERIADIENSIKLATSLGMNVESYTSLYSYWNPVTQQNEYVEVVVYFVSNAQGNNDITDENALALLDAQIANYDSKIKIQQALADKYKAQLDAYLNTGEEPAPETPEEGGEAAA